MIVSNVDDNEVSVIDRKAILVGGYYNYRFRARLKDQTLSHDEIITQAWDAGISLEESGHLTYGDKPCFGPRVKYAGYDYDQCEAVRVRDGYLEIGVFASNLFRISDEGESSQTRFDVLREFLASRTVADAGDIVGCLAADYHENQHADPLVVCSDGQIRFLSTDHTGYGEEYPALATIHDTFPLELVSGPFDGAEITVSEDEIFQAMGIDQGPKYGFRR